MAGLTFEPFLRTIILGQINLVLLARVVVDCHHWVWAVIALLVLVQSRRRVGAAVLGSIFVIGPMWLAGPGQWRELRFNWWQAAACVSYVVVGLTYLICYAISRQPSEARRSVS